LLKKTALLAPPIATRASTCAGHILVRLELAVARWKRSFERYLKLSLTRTAETSASADDSASVAPILLP